MCFVTTKSARAKIAKEDIECWKALESKGQPYYMDLLPPYIKGEINPIVKLRKEYVYSRDYYVIQEGYHSCKTKEEAQGHLWHCCKQDPYVAKFIIPKGTRYFENKIEYVSETIMLVS